ncbi:RES family NAD+ phosphorylase [soil metagenome]
MPEPAGGYCRPLSDRRPGGLQSRRVRPGLELWRVEATDPLEWTWEGFAEPRYRFDPASGRFRTRYAATALVGAFRERYRATGSVVPADHADQRLIRLVSTRALRILDLRTERNLDALGVDDQISTGQHERVWDTCQQLVDSARNWWPDLDAIVYRSRTTPEVSVNYAVFGTDGFTHESWPLAERTDVLVNLVLREGFTVDWNLDSGR